MLPSTPLRGIDRDETTTIMTAVITGDFGLPFDSGEGEVDVDVEVDRDNDESKENPGGDEIPGDEFTGGEVAPGGQASDSSEDLIKYHPNQSGEGGRGGGNFAGPTTGTPQPLLLAALVCTLWYLDGIMERGINAYLEGDAFRLQCFSYILAAFCHSQCIFPSIQAVSIIATCTHASSPKLTILSMHKIIKRLNVYSHVYHACHICCRQEDGGRHILIAVDELRMHFASTLTFSLI